MTFARKVIENEIVERQASLQCAQYILHIRAETDSEIANGFEQTTVIKQQACVRAQHHDCHAPTFHTCLLTQ
ncbi:MULTISPECIES: hypothetical protein [unclassified Pseudomonas]|uniref:hypothetical protein n=1 Tax=unclassified Pseudomonas TaxID=196821 RepID=UPI000B81403A|nr:MULTISPECIES: hypothetical protein [unclassified Pseudomonas]